MTDSALSGPAEGGTGKLFHPVAIGHIHIPGNLFLAPVAGYSDRAFRGLCIEYGASFTYTEMVSAEALVRESEKTRLMMRRAPNESQYAVQLFGRGPRAHGARRTDRPSRSPAASASTSTPGAPYPRSIKPARAPPLPAIPTASPRSSRRRRPRARSMQLNPGIRPRRRQ